MNLILMSVKNQTPFTFYYEMQNTTVYYIVFIRISRFAGARAEFVQVKIIGLLIVYKLTKIASFKIGHKNLQKFSKQYFHMVMYILYLNGLRKARPNVTF